MNGNIKISFISEKNELEYINELLSVKATKIVCQGDKVTAKRISQKNIWIYSVKFNSTNYNDEIKKFIKIFIKEIDKIRQIQKENTAIITLQIRSEFGQIGLCLDKSVLSMFSDLGLDLEVDILSFGAVKE